MQSAFPAPPHGANVILLPDSGGVVELKTENLALSKGGRKEPIKSRIIAYFYPPDSTSAPSPAPTDVKITLGGAGRGTPSALLRSTEADQFASETGDYQDTLRGQIDFELDGKPV